MRVYDAGTNKDHSSVKDYVTYNLDGQDWDLGSLEIIENAVRKNAEAIGTLLSVLCDKKIINAEELSKIVNEYPTKITFLSDFLSEL